MLDLMDGLHGYADDCATLLERINALRVTPLFLSEPLIRAADDQAAWVANTGESLRADGSTAFLRALGQGYQAISLEEVVYGHVKAGLRRAWKQLRSKPMLQDEAFADVGIAARQGQWGMALVITLGRAAPERPILNIRGPQVDRYDENIWR